MALRSLASRVRGSALDVRAAAPRARPMNYSSHLQGGHQGKGADLHPVSPTDLLPEAKWRNVKKDGIVTCGADIHTSAPRVLPPAPCTVPLLGGLPMFRRSSSLVTVKFGAGMHASAPRVPLPSPRASPVASGQPMFCWRTSSQVPSLGVPALPLACRLSRLAINAYGLTCFGSGQQQRGFSEKPFQSLDSKTAAAMYDQLSPEGRRVASLTNMVLNDSVKRMKDSNIKRFNRINENVWMLVNKVKMICWMTLAVVVLTSGFLFHTCVVIKEVVEDLTGNSEEIAAALYSGFLYTLWARLGDKFVWKDEWGKKKAAEKSEAPAKK